MNKRASCYFCIDPVGNNTIAVYLQKIGTISKTMLPFVKGYLTLFFGKPRRLFWKQPLLRTQPWIKI